ncbi:alpha/beta fold hydrolase [Photobacterium makurazakiensis]|uniref:UilS family quorum-quenching N-acyl-homoserine lactonase n=1 Tax=Photobacterium makurazakiensis TaxID=2910234 RepID=UPI003D14506E
MHTNVHFKSKGSSIAANLYLPKEKTKESYPLVILCHGFCGVKELLLPTFAERFAEHGYAALTFDYRGFGGSEGEPGRLVPELQIEDIHAAIEWASNSGHIDIERIALWGTSFGGANAIIAASQSPLIRCVSVQLAFSDGESVITRSMSQDEREKFIDTLSRMREKKEKSGKEMMVSISKVLSDSQSIAFFNQYKDDYPALNIKIPFLTIWETMNHKPLDILDNLDKPLLIVAASEDGVNPVSESEKLFKQANEPKKLHIEQSASHYQIYTGEHFESVVRQQLSWFKEYL